MVEWKRMWEVTTWDKKFSGVDKLMQPTVLKYHYYLANELAELERPNGDIRILYTTDKEAFVDSDDVEGNISEGEVVTIPWGGNVNIQYYKGRFVTADNRIATSNNVDYLCNKYLYYWMLSQKEEIGMFYRGAGIKHPSMLSVLTMLVPIPSISEQQRIVDILDTFTSSIENLKEQIALRRKQYEYYRDQLLDLEEEEGVNMKMLGDICENLDYMRKPITSSKRKVGIYPYYGASGIVDYVEGFIFDGEYLLVSEDGANLVTRTYPIAFSIKGKNWVNNHAHVLAFKNKITQKFVEIYLNKIDLSPWINGAAQPKLNKANLNIIDILVPPLSEQQRIVSILDTFDASIANLEAQLAQREKQYEYYRNKLLTFE